MIISQALSIQQSRIAEGFPLIDGQCARERATQNTTIALGVIVKITQ